MDMAWQPLDDVAIEFYERDVNQNSDPRVGSARDNSTGGTLSHLSGSDSSSASSLGSTFIPVAVYSAVCLLIFLILRRKCLRVYSPRTIEGVRPSTQELSPPLPSGWFNWIVPFFRISDSDVLKYSSLDGFLFLRYTKILCLICFAGVSFAWPILLPLHGTGGGGLSQLDLLSIGNVQDPTKFLAHVFIAWAFFGFVLFLISRECIYYVALRQAYLLSPDYAHQLSSRTVLFTCVPRPYLNEAKIRKLFGDSAKNVWIPRNTKALQDLVDDRQKTALKLEEAEIKLIRDANKAKRKNHTGPVLSPTPQPESNPVSPTVASPTLTETTSPSGPYSPDAILGSLRQTNSIGSDSTTQEGSPAEDEEYTHPYGLDHRLPDVRGSVAAQWMPAEARPSHRPISNFFRRVDTIRWARMRLKALNAQIGKVRRRFRHGGGSPISAVFVEFDTLASAQAAYQILAHHQPLHMSPKFIGVRPNEIVWSTLRMKWWERIARRFGIMALIAVAIIFWSIPAALVGMISNLKYLATNVPFLFWLEDLPSVVTGFIQGLLPALALSLLMAAVPMMLRACARAAGVPTKPLVELYTQTAYFAFQVVQVFLVTTLTSAASAALTQILQDPQSVTSLLSQNLPKASNFYLSYILVQCLAGAATGLLHLLDLFRHQILAKTAQNPRRMFRTWHRLRQVHWGSVYPKFANMGVIVLSYSCIAPLILGFAGVGMYFAHVAYKYNLIFVFDFGMDTHGLFYPRALMHLMVGLYLAEICLIGLFALQSAVAPVLLMVIFAIFTVLVHISLNEAVSPLFYALPRTLALSTEEGESALVPDGEYHGRETGNTATSRGGAAAEYYDVEQAIGEQVEASEPQEMHVEEVEEEESGGIVSSIAKWSAKTATKKISEEMEAAGVSSWLSRATQWITPDPNSKHPNFLVRWLHPEIFEDFYALRQIIPATLPQREPPGEDARHAYWPPEMWTSPPRLWIPKDEARVSRQEVAHSKGVLNVVDTGAWLDEKGRVVVDLDMAPWRDDGSIYWAF